MEEDDKTTSNTNPESIFAICGLFFPRKSWKTLSRQRSDADYGQNSNMSRRERERESEEEREYMKIIL